MANWRSHKETVHFFGPKLQQEGETFEGLGRKMAHSSTCLDTSRKCLFTGICGISGASEWLWLETEEAPQKGQNVHGFQVRTPMCHFVPVSRAYGGIWARRGGPGSRGGRGPGSWCLYGVKKRGNTTSRVPPTSQDPSHFEVGGSGQALRHP